MEELSRILQIRKSRFDRLLRAETEARERYNQACEREQEAKQKIADYQIALAKLEIELLDGLINNPVDKNGLDQIFHTLDKAKNEAVNLKNAHKQSIKDVEELEKLVNQAWNQRVEAQRKMDKMTLLNEVQLNHLKAVRRKKEQSTLDNAVETMLAFKYSSE